MPARLPIITQLPDNPWVRSRDADPDARAIFDRHYSRRRYRDGRRPAKFIGPGEYLLLVMRDYSAIFAWKKFISGDKQRGINCAIFRNEGPDSSSSLILAAEEWAAWKWPNWDRLYTYVNPRKVRSTNPGYCFLAAGWQKCGLTKGGLIILEKMRSACAGPQSGGGVSPPLVGHPRGPQPAHTMNIHGHGPGW